MSTRSIVTTALVLIGAGFRLAGSRAGGRRAASSATDRPVVDPHRGFALAFAAGSARSAREGVARPSRPSPQSQRDERHPWKPAARPRAHRVARHLRAARLADPAVPQPVQRVEGRACRSDVFATSFRHRADLHGPSRCLFYYVGAGASALQDTPAMRFRISGSTPGCSSWRSSGAATSPCSRPRFGMPGPALQRDPPDHRVASFWESSRGVKASAPRFGGSRAADWWPLAGLAVLGHASTRSSFSAASRGRRSANSALIFGCTPITVSFISAWLGHERPGGCAGPER